MDEKTLLLDLSPAEMEAFILSLKEPKFRAKQVFEWMYKGAASFDEMTNIPAALREKLKEKAVLRLLRITERLESKVDDSIKYLFELSDGNVLESVLMKYKHGYSVCISTQVGCKMGCTFCASTLAGFVRNLTPGEMLSQILTIAADRSIRVGHVVMMGIGEPLDNFEHVLKFLHLINLKEGLGIGMRHLSLSTCGLVPEILRLSEENLQLTLSISLHAPNDVLRQQIMPVAKAYSIDKILEACKIYTDKTGRRITFEYALIHQVNDAIENARELSEKLKGMLCHVNLIPVNTVEGTGYAKSSRNQAYGFMEVLQKRGIETTIRRELGSDIQAACGQLRRDRL